MLRVDRLDRAVLEAVLDRLLADVVPHEPLLHGLAPFGQWSMGGCRALRESIAVG